MKTKNRRSTTLKDKNKTRKIYGGDIDKHGVQRPPLRKVEPKKIYFFEK